MYNNDNSLASIGGSSVKNNLVAAVTQFNGGCPACNGTFTYDPRGHLFESSTIANGTTITQDNYYDALGRRVPNSLHDWKRQYHYELRVRRPECGAVL